MVKKGPLGTAEKFYVENNLHLKEEDIAKALDRSLASIKKAATVARKNAPQEEFKVDEHTDFEKVEEEEFQGIDGEKLFAREGGATVMTPGASMYGDEMAKNRAKNHNVQRSDCTVPIKRGGNGKPTA
jgi:hypothetical protein